MVQRVLRNPKPQPRFIEPMECQRVPKLPEGDDWVYEIKQDGYRVIAVVDGSTALLHSLSGMDYTREFPHIVFALKNLKRRVILDGEIVALDEQGRANFQALQNRKSTKFPIVYYAFDVLHENGKDLLDLPLADRRQRLEEIGRHFSDPLRLNPVFDTELAPLVQHVKALGLEGIVAKRSTSTYIVLDLWAEPSVFHAHLNTFDVRLPSPQDRIDRLHENAHSIVVLRLRTIQPCDISIRAGYVAVCAGRDLYDNFPAPLHGWGCLLRQGRRHVRDCSI